MMDELKIERLNQLPQDDVQPLLVESLVQGYEFVKRLVKEYRVMGFIPIARNPTITHSLKLPRA